MNEPTMVFVDYVGGDVDDPHIESLIKESADDDAILIDVNDARTEKVDRPGQSSG